MRIDGVWHLCADGFVRPEMLGDILASDGTPQKARFLVDTGADRTVFSADLTKALGLQPISTPDRLLGAGGEVDSVVVETEIRLTRDDGAKVLFKGQFAACTKEETLDMCVLGRDILNLFALIVDRAGGAIFLIGQPHFYTIGQK